MSGYTSYFLSNDPKVWSIEGFTRDLLCKGNYTYEQITSHLQTAIQEIIKLPLLSTFGKKKLTELKNTKNIGLTIKLLCDEQQQQQQQQQPSFPLRPTQIITNNITSKNVKQNYTHIFNDPESSNRKKKPTADIDSLSQLDEEKQPQQQSTTSNLKNINNLSSLQYQPADLPDYERRYTLDGYDISKDFYEFQAHISSLLDTGIKLTLESHVHHILAMSHIFLVSSKRIHSDIKNIMNPNAINILNTHLSTTYWMKEHKFSMPVFTEIVTIIKEVIEKKINRTTAATKLLSLESTSEPLEFLIITSIMMMVIYLPDETLNDDPKEMELINGYLHPCLSPLFHDPSNGILFRWCDTVNLEASKTSISISKRRPDNCITQLDGYDYDSNLGFGEVKSHHETNNKAAICKDLIRLGVFSKNSIDVGNMNAVLCFQAIGRHVTFYVTKLMADGLYIMYELASIKVPGSVDELLMYVGQVDKILDILYIFHDQCYAMTPQQQKEANKKKGKTLSTPEYAEIIEPTINKKRKSVTKHNTH